LSGSVDLAVGCGQTCHGWHQRQSRKGIRKLRGTANGQSLVIASKRYEAAVNRRFTGGYAASGRLGHTPTR